MGRWGIRVIGTAGTDAGDSRRIRTTNTQPAGKHSPYRSVASLSALFLSLLLAMLVSQACGGEESPSPNATVQLTTSPSATSTHTPTPHATATDDAPAPTATLEAAPSPSPTRTDTPTLDITPTERVPTPTRTKELRPSPSPSPSPSPVPLEEPYSSTNDGFEIRPPQGWVVDDRGALGAKVIFHGATPDLHGDSPFSANISVLIAPAQGDTLEEIAAASKEQLARTFTDYTLLAETYLIIDGLEARGFEYTFTQGEFPLRIIQVLGVHDDAIFLVTATALNAAWNEHESTFDASLRSFRILGASPSPASTDTPTPVPTPTDEPPTSTATLEPTPSPAPTSTDTPTPVPTPTDEPPTSTATPEPTPSPSPTSTDTPTPVPTPTDEPPTSTPTTEVVISPSPALLDRRYSDSTDRFELRPPYGWLADESGLLGTEVIFYGETPDLHDDTPFLANIVVQVGPAHGFTLEQIVEESNTQSSLLLTDFDLLGDESVIVNGHKARLLDFTFVHGVFPLRSRQLLFVYEDKAYAITAGSLEAAWEEHEAALDASLRSFRILDAEDSEGS